jgi:hypothetical protein
LTARKILNCAYWEKSKSVSGRQTRRLNVVFYSTELKIILLFYYYILCVIYKEKKRAVEEFLEKEKENKFCKYIIISYFRDNETSL